MLKMLLQRAIISWQLVGETAFVDWVLIRIKQHNITARYTRMHRLAHAQYAKHQQALSVLSLVGYF